MAITRTALGTAESKTSGTTLPKASVAVQAGHALVVGVAYETGQGAPTVTWGFRTLRQTRTVTQSGMATAMFVLSDINNTATRTVTATWGGAITAKVMAVSSIDGATIEDVEDSNVQTASTAPDTADATPPTSTVADTISIAFFGSRGPDTDTIGTVGSGHTSGQRVGTAGAPPISNVTLHETYEILTSTGTVQATKTGATARDWANVIVAFEASDVWSRSVSVSDQQRAKEKFESSSLDYSDAAYRYNGELDRWEVYDVTDIGTLVAHSGDGWT